MKILSKKNQFKLQIFFLHSYTQIGILSALVIGVLSLSLIAIQQVSKDLNPFLSTTMALKFFQPQEPASNIQTFLQTYMDEHVASVNSFFKPNSNYSVDYFFKDFNQCKIQNITSAYSPNCHTYKHFLYKESLNYTFFNQITVPDKPITKFQVRWVGSNIINNQTMANTLVAQLKGTKFYFKYDFVGVIVNAELSYAMNAVYSVCFCVLILYLICVMLDLHYFDTPYFKLILETFHVVLLFTSLAFFQVFYSLQTNLDVEDFDSVVKLSYYWRQTEFTIALAAFSLPFHLLQIFCIIYPSHQVTNLLEKIFRLYPFFLSMCFLIYTASFLQACALNINLKYYDQDFSNLANSLKRVAGPLSVKKNWAVPYLEINTSIFYFARTLWSCGLIAMTIYLFNKSSRIHDKFQRLPLEEIEANDRANQDLKQQFINGVQNLQDDLQKILKDSKQKQMSQ